MKVKGIVYLSNSLFITIIVLCITYSTNPIAKKLKPFLLQLNTFTNNKKLLPIPDMLISLSQSQNSTISNNMNNESEPNHLLQTYRLFNIEYDICNNNNCSPLYGRCTSLTNCRCIPGNANAPKISKETCSYIQKQQLVAFLLELFLNSGIGHFYTGLWWLGLIKLLIVGITPIVFCFLLCCVAAFNKSEYWYISLAFGLLSGIWWLVDLILYGIGWYYDGNDIPLKPWYNSYYTLKL